MPLSTPSSRVTATGALRPKSRFGAGLELLSEGVAQLYFRETRELHTLGAFDLVNLRRDLAGDVGRFAGAAALTACARDGAAIEPAGDAPVLFSVADGGVFCPRCAPTPSQPPSRLPFQAYRDLLALNDPRVELPVLDPPHAAAHRRLVAR